MLLTPILVAKTVSLVALVFLLRFGWHMIGKKHASLDRKMRGAMLWPKALLGTLRMSLTLVTGRLIFILTQKLNFSSILFTKANNVF